MENNQAEQVEKSPGGTAHRTHDQVAEFSKNMIKRIKRMSKNELVNKVLELYNYSEQQKSANMILMKALGDLEQKLAKNNEQQAEKKPKNKKGEQPKEGT
jgi:uncharacterized protein (DUF2147 family)